MTSNHGMKIICFSSHTNTWFFALAEAVVANALQKKGHDVLFITPGEQFLGKSNPKYEQILRSEFGLKGFSFSSVLEKKDFKEISQIVKGLNSNNFENLIIDNIKLGKIALYEFLVERKKMDINFTTHEWKAALNAINKTLISFYACRKIITKEKPDRILMYNSLYSINHAWESYAERKGIPVYFLHNGLNFADRDNTLIIARKNSFYFLKKLKTHWTKVKNLPVSKKMLSYVTDHFLELLKASHPMIYSAPKSIDTVSIRKIFNIKDHQKILTATMSSYDELFAAEYIGVWKKPKNIIFPNQADWIKNLIEYVRKKKNLFLIVRIHPREFPNKRERVKSQHAEMLEKLFINLPDNVKINWPPDNISLYNLAQETDTFLNSWSSAGVEMSLLGIPVVIYSNSLVNYPPSLNYVGKSKKDYFIKIETALKNGWSYNRVKKTYRWLALNYYRTIIKYSSKKQKTEQKTEPTTLFKISNYIFNKVNPKVRLRLRKKVDLVPYFNNEDVLREICKNQLNERVEISKLEKMLAKVEDFLDDTNALTSKILTNDMEDQYLRFELKRLQIALSGSHYNNYGDKKDLDYYLSSITPY